MSSKTNEGPVIYMDLFRALFSRSDLKSFLALISCCRTFRNQVFLNANFWLEKILAIHPEPKWKVLNLEATQLLRDYYLVAYSHADRNIYKVKDYNRFRKNEDGSLMIPDVPTVDIDESEMKVMLEKLFKKAWLTYRLSLPASNKECLKFIGRVVTYENGKKISAEVIPGVPVPERIIDPEEEQRKKEKQLRQLLRYGRHERGSDGKLKIGQINHDRLLEASRKRLANEGSLSNRHRNNNGFLDDEDEFDSQSSGESLVSSNPPKEIPMRKIPDLRFLEFCFEVPKEKTVLYWDVRDRHLEVQSFPDKTSKFLMHPVDRMSTKPLNVNDDSTALEDSNRSSIDYDEISDEKLKTIMFKLHPELKSVDIFETYERPLKEFRGRYHEFRRIKVAYPVDFLYERFKASSPSLQSNKVVADAPAVH